ncbi:glypican, partial [Opisthorchis viverrini]
MATLHSNFKRSYGYNYELNQDFFFQFFDGLAKYMLGQKQNLSLMIDMFFRELLIRIVRLMLLAKSESDLRTADCVAEGLEKQNPFDQTPEIIKALMGRAFPPARIAANALLLGNEMIGSIMNHTSLRVACVRHWLELRYCSLCSATVNAYICPHSCRLAFDSCLSNVRPLALKWASFIDVARSAICISTVHTSLTDRLLPVLGALQGPTSFPQVNRPIQMHITDAIMNLQRVFSRLDQMLLTNCSHYGIALSNRLRRSTPFRYPTSQAPPRTDFGQPLHQIEALGDWSRKAVEKYSKFRNLLTDLPARFCTDDFLRTRRPFRASTQPCWNGEHLVDGSSFRIETEPELLPSISSTGQDASTDTLYHELQRMSEKLDAITRYHADPDYLPVDNSYVSRYSDTVASWRDTPEFATTLERGKLAVSSNVVPEFLGSEGERRGMLNMTAPFELSRPSDGSVGDRQNPIPVHEGGSGSLPSIHQNNIWTLGREPENDGYLLLSQHASDSVVRDPVSPSERHSDFASPLGSRLDDEDTVMQSYNEAAEPNDVARGKKQTPFDLVTEVRENQSNSSRGLPGHRSAVVSSTQIRKIHAHQHHDPPDQIWIPAKAVQTLDMHSGVPHSRHFFNSNWYFFFSILLFSL